MKTTLTSILFALFFISSYAQELNIRVQVTAPKVANINKKNVELIQTTIRSFLNNNKWSNENYLPQERIEGNLVVTITAWDGNSAYKAEAQLQTSRPVFGTAYNSTLLNYNDKDFDFTYTEGQPVDFSDQNYLSNLSSLLSYYAYTIIGLDKDSFSKLGGSAYYLKAQNILNVAQVSGNSGWKAYDGLRNRYWLNENLLNKGFQELRVFIYNYHANTLDHIQDDPATSAKTMLSFLPELKQMDKQKLGSIFPNVYFATKADELVNILSLGSFQERAKAYELLSDIDPANINKYDSLKKN
jgi:Flp pilus assembly protein TadG